VPRAVASLLLLLACAHQPLPFRPGLCQDRTVTFEALAITVPITQPGSYVRLDGFRDDLDRHQAELTREFGLTGLPSRLTNAASNGRTMRVVFAGGERCDVAWARPDPHPLVNDSRLEHEKYHVVAHLAPERIGAVERALAARGLPVSLGAVDEESAASIVEIASIHLRGIPLDQIHGSAHVEMAVAALEDARRRAGHP
jgi:hypothetical protein